MAKKSKSPKNKLGVHDLDVSQKELLRKNQESDAHSTGAEKADLKRILESQEKSKNDEERIELAKKFNIDLVRPKQSNRITALYDLYQEHINSSQPVYYLYANVIFNAEGLKEIYQKQLVELLILEKSKENKDFLKTRLVYIINHNRSKIQKLNKAIKHDKMLLQEYEKGKINWTSVTPEVRNELNELDNKSWFNYFRSLEINKELRNTIIGYENRLCIFKVGKLFLDYKLYVKQELERYKDDLEQLGQENHYEYNEILRHFNLPLDKLPNFKHFVKRKLESKIQDAQDLKESFNKFYDYDVHQIDRTVNEVKIQQEKERVNLIKVINHYKRLLLKKQTKTTNEVNFLVNYIKKCFNEKVELLLERLSVFQKIHNEKAKLHPDQKQLLLDLNRNELDYRIEKLKQSYTNQIKPLTDDFDNMLALIERDNVFDHKVLKEKVSELKSLENENVNYLKLNFETEKENLTKLFDSKYKLIEDSLKFTKDEFESKISDLKNYVYGLCEVIITRNERAWTQANIHFNAQAKRYLSKFHFETAPWNHLWKTGHRAWMHDYLLINLSSEYLFRVGQSIKNFSPESQLYINIGKALAQFNEKSRELYKNRDEIEYEQLIRLNSVPKIKTTELRQKFEQTIKEAKKVKNQFTRVLASFQEKLS